MSVDIHELTAEVSDEARRQEVARGRDAAADPQKMQKMMRQAADRRDWARERLQA